MFKLAKDIISSLGITNHAAVFEGLNSATASRHIKKWLAHSAGVYIFISLLTGQVVYVRTRISNELGTGVLHHIKSSGNTYLRNMLSKHGLENFIVVIVSMTYDLVNSDHLNNVHLLLDLEDKALIRFKPVCNIRVIATNPLVVRPGESTYDKSNADNAAYAQSRKVMLSQIVRAAVTAERRANLRAQALARLAHSPEALDTSIKAAGRSVSVELLDGTIIGTFDDLRLAAKALDCGEKTIKRALKKDGIVKKTYLIKDTFAVGSRL